jgi:two-component system sensor histidine kinase DegS
MQERAAQNDLIRQAGALLREVEAHIASLARQADEQYHDLLAQWQQRDGASRGSSWPADDLESRLAECRRTARQLNLLAHLHRDLVGELEGQTATPSEGDLRADWPRIRLIRSQEESYLRIARELRGGVGQIMANAVLELEYFDHLSETDLPAAREGLQSLKEEIRAGFKDLQRIIEDLGPPPLLVELGLAPSLRRHIENFRDELGLEATVDIQALPVNLSQTMEIAIFRIVQEALLNIRKHAQATSIEVRAYTQDDELKVSVADNGRGFQVDSHGEELSQHLGLISMRDRADLLGGRLQIRNREQQGTEVILTVPYPFVSMAKGSSAAGGKIT